MLKLIISKKVCMVAVLFAATVSAESGLCDQHAMKIAEGVQERVHQRRIQMDIPREQIVQQVRHEVSLLPNGELEQILQNIPGAMNFFERFENRHLDVTGMAAVSPAERKRRHDDPVTGKVSGQCGGLNPPTLARVRQADSNQEQQNMKAKLREPRIRAEAESIVTNYLLNSR